MYQGLNKHFKSGKKEEPLTIRKEKPAITDESKLMYGNKYSFSDYRNLRKYYDLSFTAKYYKLLLSCHPLNKFRNLILQAEKTEIKKRSLYKSASNLYNTPPVIYFNDYNNSTDKEKEKMVKIWS